MKKLFNKLTNTINHKFITAKLALGNNRAEGYVDTAIKILIAVVLGALLLAGLYTLFGETVLPTLTRRVQEMFEYHG
jgi:ABC-type phosphate transport system permease subunit